MAYAKNDISPIRQFYVSTGILYTSIGNMCLLLSSTHFKY